MLEQFSTSLDHAKQEKILISVQRNFHSVRFWLIFTRALFKAPERKGGNKLGLANNVVFKQAWNEGGNKLGLAKELVFKQARNEGTN